MRVPLTVLIERHAGYSEVEWRCSECEFNGIIRNWQGPTTDHSEPEVPNVEVAFPRR